MVPEVVVNLNTSRGVATEDDVIRVTAKSYRMLVMYQYVVKPCLLTLDVLVNPV